MNKDVLDNYHFSWAKTMADVKKVVKYCKMTGYCAHDYETSGHLSSDHRGYPTCISIAFQPGYAYVIPLAHKDSPLRKGNKWKRILKYIGRELIQNDRIVKVAHNFKFEHGWWLKYGIRPRGVILDTMLMKYLLNEKRPHDLKSLAYSFFPQYANYSIKGEDTERTPEEVVQFWSNVPLETLAPYNALDSDLCLRLAIYLEQRIRECGFYQLYRNLLEMASYNLAEVESRGYLVDRPYLDGLCESYKTKIEEAEAKMYAVPSLIKYNKKRVKAAKKALLDGLLEQIEIKTNELDSTTDKKKLGSLQRSITNLQKKYDNYSAGVGLTKKDKESLQPLNLKSVKQLIDFLYYNKYGLRLPIIKYTEDKKTKKPTKNPATSEDVLLELKDKDETGFIETLLKYREMTKLYSTYIVGIRDILNPDNTLHGSFLIHGCVTEDTVLVGKEGDIVIGDIAPKEVGVKDVVKDNIYVLTHARTWEQVTHTINKGVLDTYRVTTDRGDVLECTKYHKLLTPRGFKPIWKIAKYNLDVIMHDVSRLDIQPVEVGKKYGEVVFKEIPNWPGYLASSEGKIFSVKIPGAQGMLDYNNPHEMVPRVQKSGNRLHSRVGLRNGTGIKKMIKKMLPVSRLVWSAFNNASIPDGYVIDHIDCNPLNNIPENLRCITYSENTKRAYKNTRTAFTNGAINGKTVLDTQTVGQILLDYREGLTQGQIVEKYGISQAQVRRVINDELWKYIYLTKIRVEYIGKKTIMDLSVNDKHSYVTRSNYVSCNTVTGRLSSRNPNLQNMPRDTTAKDIKYMFVCPKGKVMMQLDYSQAELRVVAGWSQDKQMLEWFRVGHDIHLATACKKYKISYEDAYKIYSNEDDPDFKIWKVRRKQAKTIGFGVLYQQGPNHLKESLSTPDHKATKEEAIEFLDEWFDTFPRIRKFVKKQQKFAEEHGYVVSPFGRKRRLPEARNKREQGKYAKALRDAVNAPIQGTASDFALFSSILIREQIMQGKLPASIEQIGTIHDSLMFYLDPKDMNDEVVDHLFNICKDPDTQKYFGFKLKGITMAVDFELGLRWSKLKGYKRGTDYAEVYKDCYIDHWWENKEIVALQEAS
uniref:DNA-directed DNA polymerase n=1 Tax=Ackermannviridae sp. ctUml7 TaxID=2825753 RepID=A0A8S5V9F0_9CAUD|nr:MAG TPA: DNA polymerase [Ackermannviridae sp. ctUml7]